MKQDFLLQLMNKWGRVFYSIAQSSSETVAITPNNHRFKREIVTVDFALKVVKMNNIALNDRNKIYPLLSEYDFEYSVYDY